MSEVRSFTIYTDRIGPRRWCWVRIHPDADHLRAAGHRHRPDNGRDWWDECFGCFQPSRYEVDDTTGAIRYPANGYAGVLRLSAPDAAAEIVAHELVHAAATVYRMNGKRTSPTSTASCSPRSKTDGTRCMTTLCRRRCPQPRG